MATFEGRLAITRSTQETTQTAPQTIPIPPEPTEETTPETSTPTEPIRIETEVTHYIDPKAAGYRKMGEMMANLALYADYMHKRQGDIPDEFARCVKGIQAGVFDGTPNATGSLTFNGATFHWRDLAHLGGLL